MNADPRNRKLLKEALAGLPEDNPMSEAETKASTPCVKVFMADGGGRWFLTEKDVSEPEYVRYFGLCDLSLGFPELGWVGHDELMQVEGALHLGVELDEWFDGTISDGYEYVGEAVPSWMAA